MWSVRNNHLPLVAFVGTLLGLAIVQIHCGGGSASNQPAPDASADTGGVDGETPSDGSVSEGQSDDAPLPDVLLDEAAAPEADAPFDVGVGPCTPLSQCSCDTDAASCHDACVQTVCASSCTCSAPKAICPDPKNGTCECGFALVDHCTKPDSHCLCTSCADAPGALCVTDAQQTQLCSGPFRSAFACP